MIVTLLSVGIYLFIYLFIRNNYYKFANKTLDFIVVIIVLEIIYMYFSNVIFSEETFGSTVGSLIFIVGFNILEKKQNKYMKDIYEYFENFNELIWLFKSSNLKSDKDVLKIRDNITTVLRREETKGRGIYIIYISQKEREIRYILLFYSKFRCESYFNNIGNVFNVEKFTINNTGILTLQNNY